MHRRLPNSWKLRTADDDTTLRKLLSEGVPLTIIAKQLGRTPLATERRAQVLARTAKAPFDPSSG